MKVGFIGLGNMAGAMIGGLVKDDSFTGEIFGFDVAAKVRESRAKEFGITACTSNKEVVSAADYLVLAVKPQFIGSVIQEIRELIRPEQVVISIVAGKSINWFTEAFGKEIKLVRCMPNTAALVGAAITGVTPAPLVTEEELAAALSIIESFGKASVVSEHLMDAVVGVSGSAPAYVFLFIEAMADGAVAAGMPRTQAYEFAAQAVYGSAKLMMDTGKHPGELKDMVCSPAGTTIEAVKVLEEKNFRGAVIDAVLAATEKSKKL